MFDWVGQAVYAGILVIGAMIPAGDAQAADEVNPLVGEWRGEFETGMGRKGPVEINITQATDAEAIGTGMVGGRCGATFSFRGKIEDGKLVIQEDLSRPCGATTLTLKPEGGSLSGQWRTRYDGGALVLVKQ